MKQEIFTYYVGYACYTPALCLGGKIVTIDKEIKNARDLKTLTEELKNHIPFGFTILSFQLLKED